MAEILNVLENVTGWLSDNEAVFLNHHAAKVQAPNVIVEIGSFQGKSTIALAYNASVPVYAIDPHEDHTDEIGGVFGRGDMIALYNNLQRAGLADKVTCCLQDSDDACRLWNSDRDEPQEFIGLLFVDGAHNYAQVHRDVFNWLPHMARNSIIALHDRTWPDIARVVSEIGDFPSFVLRRYAICDSIIAYEVHP